MKLKLLAAALAVGLASQASAATIDTGANGNGGVFFNVWDSTGSYVLNLNVTLDAFETAVNSGSGTIYSFNVASDPLFTSWISSHSSYSWNILAADSQGAVRVLETITQTATVTPKGSDVLRTAAGQTTILTQSINTAQTLLTSDSATFTSSDKGYIFRGPNPAGLAVINANLGLPTLIAAQGTDANNSYDTGLLLVEAKGNVTGTAKVAYNYLGSSTGTRVYFDGSDLVVSQVVVAVPEPETYAMFLAGLGLMGAIARRRRQG